MAITIKNNTTKLQDLKNKVNALPDKEEGGTVVLDQTTVSPADVLVNKTYYSADADGQPVKGTGEMNNLGEINVVVGLNGTGQNPSYGYITGATATFSAEINEEIDTQAGLIAQIKSVLNNKMAGSDSGEGDTLKGVIEGDCAEIVIPEGVIKIRKNFYTNSESLTSIKFPSTLCYIYDGAFSNCKKINKLEFPDSVLTFGSSVFSNCSKLTSVTLSANLTSIGNYVFQGCTGLKKLNIPKSISNLGIRSIAIGSTTYKDAIIRFEGAVPPICASTPFGTSVTTNGLKRIEVPASGLVEFKSATNISEWGDYIIGYETFEADATLPDYTTGTFTTQHWYSDSACTIEVTEISVAGEYYLKLS